jgi:hypothetical protein
MRVVVVEEVEAKKRACCSGVKEDKGVVGEMQKAFRDWLVSEASSIFGVLPTIHRAFSGFCCEEGMRQSSFTNRPRVWLREAVFAVITYGDDASP